ncbi:MAG: hypothetical protein BEN18_10770 [Epulopiscium sp. Nuni2H_MBin001]|nr:MAG: hypothetical protein BEN18_10770 [Epulopiscium sp. Nuni2H_MBin001]
MKISKRTSLVMAGVLIGSQFAGLTFVSATENNTTYNETKYIASTAVTTTGAAITTPPSITTPSSGTTTGGSYVWDSAYFEGFSPNSTASQNNAIEDTEAIEDIESLEEVTQETETSKVETVEVEELVPQDSAENKVLKADNFNDIKQSSWYYWDVVNVSELGLMTGVSETNWAPNENVTRAQLATILNRLDGEPIATATNKFADVVDNVWYTNSINWAVGADIYGGFEDGTFRPNDDVTREQLATIMYNYSVQSGLDVSIKGSLSNFSDSDKVASWATPAVEWAIGAGILGGKDQNNLDPKGTATRAEMAAVMTRFINLQ